MIYRGLNIKTAYIETPERLSMVRSADGVPTYKWEFRLEIWLVGSTEDDWERRCEKIEGTLEDW
jgi:hypothetical protein